MRSVKPSIMRVFMSTSKPVEFLPRGPEDVAAAEQATQYIHYVFTKNDGYRVLNDAIHDALIKKVGIVKAYWESWENAEIFTYDNLTDQEYMMLASDDTVDILEHSSEMSVRMDEMGMEIEEPSHSMKISKRTPDGQMRLESVPPEEFFVNSQAKTLKDATIVAHRTEMTVGDLVEMGFDFDEVYDLDGLHGASDISETEGFERRGYTNDDYDDEHADPAMRLIAVTEAYMKIDIDGTGVPVLHRFICGGTNYRLLDFELGMKCLLLRSRLIQSRTHSLVVLLRRSSWMIRMQQHQSCAWYP